MKNRTIKSSILLLTIYIISAVMFHSIVGESFQQSQISTEMLSADAVIGELLAGQSVSQEFKVETDTVDAISVMGATYERNNSDTLIFSVEDKSGNILASEALNTVNLPNNSLWTVTFSDPVKNIKGKSLVLRITSQNATPGNAVTLYYGSRMNAGKFDIAVHQNKASLNGTLLDGSLCLSVKGTEYYALAQYYWPFIGAIGLMLVLYLLYMIVCERKGRSTAGLKTIEAFFKYRFLLKQLVTRSFKTKYKRSILGMLWSFLNPLLTMLVLYLIFSTLFRSSIPNFPVYLLTGIVCWNFFSEVTAMCLNSITGNAALIMKVYVPKYMYPLSSSVSSSVNFGISLIPLLVVLLITQTRITIAYLILLFPFIALFCFSLGMGLLLASAMVFFRDIQFLWGILSTLWMYLTPIFYDPDIIPDNVLVLYKMNPLYHILRIVRILIINGTSPEPKAYILCLIASLVPLILGVFVFKKTQDRFVLYL